jgi:hypothetical protein
MTSQVKVSNNNNKHKKTHTKNLGVQLSQFHVYWDKCGMYNAKHIWTTTSFYCLNGDKRVRWIIILSSTTHDNKVCRVTSEGKPETKKKRTIQHDLNLTSPLCTQMWPIYTSLPHLTVLEKGILLWAPPSLWLWTKHNFHISWKLVLIASNLAVVSGIQMYMEACSGAKVSVKNVCGVQKLNVICSLYIYPSN